MSLVVPLMLSSLIVANAVAQDAAPARVVEPTDRTVLPIPEPQYPHSTVFDARNATPPPRFQVKAPPNAPNVLIVLIDDMGFGQSSAFGGPIHMPTVEGLANSGLRYNEFHTTALCSPSRSALLSGRNHHMNNFGSIAETATAFPGQTGKRPNSVATIAEMLRLNGYSTAQFGKNHETAPWEVSPSGPTDRWPTRQGFDKFYGFMGGETNQWAPLIYDGMTQVRNGEHIVGADSTLHCPAFLPPGRIFAESFQDTRHTYLTVPDYRSQQQPGPAPNQDIAPSFEWSYAQAET
jgi:hypothetical protein